MVSRAQEGVKFGDIVSRVGNGTIDRFSGAHRFLSNFYPSPIRYPVDEPDAPVYPTVEHAFQAAKSIDPAEQARVRAAPNPATAKGIGRRIGSRRPDWSAVRVDVMRELLRAKFDSEPRRSLLLSTGHAELVEGNLWHDTFWGRCTCARHRGAGVNLLGRLLMEVRAELAAQAGEDAARSARDGSGEV